MASEASEADGFVSAAEWGVVIHRSEIDYRLRAVHLRSGEPGSLPTAADLADVSGWRLGDVGGTGSALRRESARRPDVQEQAARPRHHRDRRVNGGPVRFNNRNGQR